MIEQILDLSQVETGRMAMAPRRVKLKEACASAIAEVAPVARAKSVEITLDDAESEAELFADPMRVRQVLSNLITNAVKYNDAGGRVRIGIEEREDGQVDVRVEDNGWGIPEYRRDELFRPFARLGRDAGPVEGAGIGLALTRRIVELMDGSVRYEPKEGRGSAFVVTLQTVAGPGEAGTPMAERAVLDDPTTPLTVLYIEDNSSNIDLMRQIFGLVIANAELVVAESGARGIEIAEAAEPDLILLDIGLQDMDGFAVLAALRSRLGARMPRVVFVTADATPKTRERAAALGILELVTKPFDVRDIVAVTRAGA
ncbi:MAG: ATP-binding protein, partial [Alphaproteobacteria bacterium]